MVGILADLACVVAGEDEVLGDFGEAVVGGEVQACVAFVGEVGVEEEAGVVADEAADEEDVVEEDGSSEAGGGVYHSSLVMVGRVKRSRKRLGICSY